ncbi:hypothetical protein [Labedaea rhizosphaerae]|uniref:Uncharacterized protein n=1 Tax=Labedaea rhizosphaerae TaxID=598644 RepID=A0A4R6SJN1_LABRH|nr:hypothetical protein [Labedaea rhizosphaerae]TDQ04097.1 hypothetical protein EV186_10138 [Labedaea rhizosphaerae]
MTWQLLGMGVAGLLVTIRVLAKTVSHHLLVRAVIKKGGRTRIEIQRGSTIIYDSGRPSDRR